MMEILFQEWMKQEWSNWYSRYSKIIAIRAVVYPINTHSVLLKEISQRFQTEMGNAFLRREVPAQISILENVMWDSSNPFSYNFSQIQLVVIHQHGRRTVTRTICTSVRINSDGLNTWRRVVLLTWSKNTAIINQSLDDNIQSSRFSTMNNLVLVAALLLSSSLPVCFADERTSSVGWNKKVGPTNIKMKRLPRSWVQNDEDAY